MPRAARLVDLDPEFVSLTQASQLLSLGKTTIHKLINNGQLDTLKCGKKRLVRLRSIRNFGGQTAEADVRITLGSESHERKRQLVEKERVK